MARISSMFGSNKQDRDIFIRDYFKKEMTRYGNRQQRSR